MGYYLADASIASILGTGLNVVAQGVADVNAADPGTISSGTINDINSILNDVKSGAATQQIQTSLSPYGGSTGLIIVAVLAFFLLSRRGR